jgi:hypothetical protein
MKKVLLFAAMAVIAGLVFSSIPQVSYAQTEKEQKQLQKQAEKYAKNKKKSLDKEGGWKVSGTAKTLEIALQEYYLKLESDKKNNSEIVGEVSTCKSINVCKQAAFNNAATEYANTKTSEIKGRAGTEVSSDQTTGEEQDKFYAAFERLMKGEINGILKPSFSIVKEKADGTKEYKTFFIVNEETASKARLRALENAAKETEIAQEYARKISEFVREGFEGNE